MAETDVLVVGAGPAGLALALQARAHGARVRVVERRTERFRASRALIVHPRTLEVLRPLGVTDALQGRGDMGPSVRLHLGSRDIPVNLGPFAIDDSAFPYLLFERQADVEAVLAEALAGRGIPVERGVELLDLRLGADGAEGRLRRAARYEEVRCLYVAGCDGSLSTVRRLAGIGWQGGPYRQEVVLADLELDGDLEKGVSHAVAGRLGVVFIFAMGERASWRMLATRALRPTDGVAGQPEVAVPTDELQGLIDAAGLALRVTDVAWSTRVLLQHRMASDYRQGPLFLVGDAAHVHSPAGGQGMNTGIQDAANLGWKLAFAARGQATPVVVERLLASYERERQPVARHALALTNAMFWAEASLGPVAAFLRSTFVPFSAPLVARALGCQRLVAEGVRMLSQLRVNYRHSELSVEGVPHAHGGPRPGYRLPDKVVSIEGARRHLHEVLASPGVHLIAESQAKSLVTLALDPLVHIHRRTDGTGAGVVGVRPDGYVGLRSATGALDEIRDWLSLLAVLLP